MSRITDLTILQKFTNESTLAIYGLYWCKFQGSYKLFTRNGDIFKVLTRWFDKDELDIIRDDVKQELLQEIESLKNQ